MNPVSIQGFNHAESKLRTFAMVIPIIAVGPSIAAIVLSLARVVHGLVMSAFYAIKERHSEESEKDQNREFKEAYLNSASRGGFMLGVATLNLVTLGILFGGIHLHEHCKEQSKKSQRTFGEA
jgi:hypothetical protein